jgi:hypothetical protein
MPGMFLSSELLPIYLNDHFAAATAGCELARRAAGSNEGTEFGPYLKEFAGEAEADRSLLEDIMVRLGISRDSLKTGAFWLGEKLGRLKLNGRLVEYSPLSRVIEIEGLIAGSHARKNLWRTLAAAAPSEARIADVDFVRQVERVDEQLEALEAHHGRAVELMLASDPRP